MCSIAQLCSTLCDSMDYSPSGYSVHEIFQARILEWVAVSFSKGSSWPRDQMCTSCIDRWILYHCATWEKPRIKKKVNYIETKFQNTKKYNIVIWKNAKILKKKKKERKNMPHIHRWEDLILLRRQYASQTHLQTQCNPYQNPSWFLCRNWHAKQPKQSWNKNSTVGGLTLPYFKTYYKVTASISTSII